MLKRPCLSKTIFVMDQFFGSLNYYFGSFFSPVRFILSLSVRMVRSYYSIDDFSTDLTLNCGLVRVDANDVVKMSWFKHWPNDTTFEFQKDGVNLYDVVQKCRPVGECTDKEGEPFITNKIWDYKMRNLQVQQVFSTLQYLTSYFILFITHLQIRFDLFLTNCSAGSCRTLQSLKKLLSV